MHRSLLFLVAGILLSPSAFADEDWYSSWLTHVSAIQAEQPSWVTPLATITPRLEQEFRSDFIAQQNSSGYEVYSLGNSKGLEFIPIDPVEVLINVPPFFIRNQPKSESGFGDFSAAAKYRILSSNAAGDDDILTAILLASFPTGTAKNGAVTSILTPTLAGGKGFGPVDVQMTFGMTVPMTEGNIVGNSLVWNSALQYHVEQIFWPEVEDNYTRYMSGSNGGNTQNFITPGLMVGRFPLHERTGLTVGGGYQVATTHFYLANHSWILSARLPF
jgi:hypothetical protein